MPDIFGGRLCHTWTQVYHGPFLSLEGWEFYFEFFWRILKQIRLHWRNISQEKSAHSSFCQPYLGLIKLSTAPLGQRCLVNERWKVVQLPLARLTRWSTSPGKVKYSRVPKYLYLKCELTRSTNFIIKEVFQRLCINFAISQFETSVVGIKSSPRTFSLLPSFSSFTSNLKVMRPFSSFPQKIPGTRLAKHGLLFMACTNLGDWTVQGRRFEYVHLIWQQKHIFNNMENFHNINSCLKPCPLKF